MHKHGGNTSRPAAAGGFTLIEVLLAFVVFAISFTMVLEILSGSMRNTMRAREDTEIALIAQSVMDDVGLDIPLEAGASRSGDSGNYQWELNVTPFAGDAGNEHSVQLADLTGIKLLEVECLISRNGDAGDHVERFSTVKAVLERQ